MIKGFIEVTMKGDACSRIVNIQQIVEVSSRLDRTAIILLTNRKYAVMCEETYEEVKQLIEEATE